MADLPVDVALVRLQILADAVARGLGARHMEPVTRGVRVFALDDLDHVPTLELVIQRLQFLDEAATRIPRGDTDAGHMVAHVSMDAVREIQRRGAGGQLAYVTGGREDEYLLFEHIAPDSLHRALRACRAGRLALLLPLLPLLPPALYSLRLRLRVVAHVLVIPVHGDTILGRLVHRTRANLDLGEPVVQAEDGGMQRLIAVRLGIGDEVLDPPVFRAPQAVHVAQREIALLDRVDDDAKRQDVVEL